MLGCRSTHQTLQICRIAFVPYACAMYVRRLCIARFFGAAGRMQELLLDKAREALGEVTKNVAHAAQRQRVTPATIEEWLKGTPRVGFG